MSLRRAAQSAFSAILRNRGIAIPTPVCSSSAFVYRGLSSSSQPPSKYSEELAETENENLSDVKTYHSPPRTSILSAKILASLENDDTNYEPLIRRIDPEELEAIEKKLEGLPRRQRAFMMKKLLRKEPPKPETFGHLRKVYQMRIIDVNRTCKVTKGGGILSFNAFVVCGNGDGSVGFGKGKSSEVPVSVDKAYTKSLRNLHYFERFQKRTIFEPLMAKYEKTKVYMWPSKPGSGIRAGGTVGGILKLAGYKDVKTKVIGSRHPVNTVKATFKALSMVELPELMAAREAEKDILED